MCYITCTRRYGRRLWRALDCGQDLRAKKEFHEDFRPLSKVIFVGEKVEETTNLSYISFELSEFVFG